MTSTKENGSAEKNVIILSFIGRMTCFTQCKAMLRVVSSFQAAKVQTAQCSGIWLSYRQFEAKGIDSFEIQIFLNKTFNTLKDKG